MYIEAKLHKMRGDILACDCEAKVSKRILEWLRESEDFYDRADALAVIQHSVSDATMKGFLRDRRSSKKIVYHIIPNSNTESKKNGKKFWPS